MFMTTTVPPFRTTRYAENFLRWSASLDGDYEDGDDDDDDEDGPAPKRLRNVTGNAVKKRKRKPKLPGAGPFNADYAIHTHGLPALKKRKDLNIQADYGDNGQWGRDAGLRELLQNTWDGCIAFMQDNRPAATADDIQITVLRDGERLETDAEADGPQWDYDLNQLNNGSAIVFVFTVKDTLPEPPALPQPPTVSKPNVNGTPNRPGKRTANRRQSERDGEIWNNPRLLGWIGLKATSDRKFVIELFNIHPPLTLAMMTFGATTKATTEELAGEHGDGMKMGVNAIIRPEENGRGFQVQSPDVHYITGTAQWDFAYNDEASLEVRETKSDIPFVPGILIRVIGFPRRDVHINRFLFLRPPDICMATALGSILLDARLAHEVYVKRIHVLKYDRLTYGVNITKDVSLSRDRDGFHTDYDIAAAVYPIWARLFLTDVKAKDLYLKLLLGPWSSVEVEYSDDLMERRDLKVLWKHLREQQGPDVFFYCIDSQEDLRITETILRKKPYGLSQKFYALLLKHKLIQTPEQARTEQFRNLDASLVPKRPLPDVQFTLHLIDAFLQREKEMACYRDAYSFKAALPSMGIEVDTAGQNIFINDCTLSYVYVHMKHPECPSYLRYRATLDDAELVLPHADYSALSEEHKFPDVGHDFICPCSALHILSLLGQENTKVSRQWKIDIPYTRRNILQTLPRDVRFQALKSTRGWSSGGMQLSWCTPAFVLEFIVTITDVESRTSLLANISDTGTSTAMEASAGAGAEDSSSEKSFTLTRNCFDTTFHFKDDNAIPLGRKYVVQICSTKQGSLYSVPYYFSVPPSPPRPETVSVVRHQLDKVLISWEVNPDEGADSWVVAVRVKGEEVVRKEVSTTELDEKIEGLSTDVSETDLTDIVVNIYAKSSQCDGLVSPNHASWPADRVSLTPDPPALRHDDDELEYVDNEHSLAMMAANFDQDDDDDEAANQFDNNMSVDIEEPECKVEELLDVPEVALPTYDDLVAKPTLPSSDDKTYVTPKARFVNKKRLAADHYYTATLRGSDDREITSVIYVHTIGIPDDPGDDEVVTLSQYVPWELIHRNAPSNGLLLVCHPDRELADRARFRISDILDIHSDPVPVSNVDVLADFLPDVEGARFCKWKVVFAGAELEFVPVVGSVVPIVPLASLEFGDLSCGIGSASHGFREAGFNLRFGVEREERMSHLFQMNCATPVYHESVDNFLGRSWSETPMLEYPLGVLFINGGPESALSKVKAHFVRSIQEFRPAYAICTLSLQKMTRLELSKMEYDAMKFGYSLRSRILDAADFGIAAHREYLVIMASAPGRNIPDFPLPREDAPLALQDVISDLTWVNPTCRQSNQGFGTRFTHVVDSRQPFSSHCTNCYIPDVESWDSESTIVEWDKPLPETFVLPSKSVRCRHPGQPERFLSVRELARILSFPDHWTFAGSLEQQYAQLASAIPPRLAQAIAEEVRKVLVLTKTDDA